jgi:transposase
LEDRSSLRRRFVLQPDILDIRTYARQRQNKASDLAREKNRMDKLLSESGIRLGVVVSDIHGVAARRMLDCFIEGGTVEEALQFAGTRLKAAKEELMSALEGALSEHRRCTPRIALDHVKELEIKIADMDSTLLSMVAPYQKAIDLLQTIQGLYRGGGATLLFAEIGPDMEAFGTPEKIASWAGLRPGDNESAGKRKSGKTRKGDRWIRRVLREAAHAAVKTECALQAKFRDLFRLRGCKRSITALAHIPKTGKVVRFCRHYNQS